MKKNKYVNKISVGVGLFIILLVAFGVWKFCQRGNEVVLYVNDSPVYAEEFSFYIEENRAKVSASYAQKYQTTEGKDFWNTKYGDMTPKEELLNQCKEQVIRTRVIQLQAKQRGLLKDESYENFLVELQAENIKRSKAKEKGEVLYGLEQYTRNEYYRYLVNNLEIRLSKYMIENELTDGTSNGEEDDFQARTFQIWLEKEIEKVRVEETSYISKIKIV